MQSAALARYRATIARRPPLDPALERDLADRCRRGDQRAGHRLVEACLSAVFAIALEYRRCGLPIEDLVQEGNIGLLKAVEHFDPDRGVRLSTYAGYWIRAEIRAYVVRGYRVVKLGTTKGEQRALWLYRRTREARPEVLAEMSGLTLSRATDLLPLLLANDVSLTPRSDDDGPSLADRLAHGAESAEAALGDAEALDLLRDELAALLAELPAREQDIARRRLLAEEPLTLEELGAAWGVSKERVRQVEDRLKARMRERLSRVRDELNGPADSEPQPSWPSRAPRRSGGAPPRPALSSAT